MSCLRRASSALSYFATDDAGNVETAHSADGEGRQHAADDRRNGRSRRQRGGMASEPGHGVVRLRGQPGPRLLSPAVQLEAEGARQVVTGTATDLAGHADVDLASS